MALDTQDWEAMALVKPQSGQTGGRRAVESFAIPAAPGCCETWSRHGIGWGAQTAGVVDSGLPGPKGNREFFLHLLRRERPALPDELSHWIDAAVGG